ncbi:MAG: efflux RND transporter periplasmic adaptor subunit [Bryobacteraceae bacterium]
MKLKWKILIAIAVLVTIGGGTFASISYSRRGIVTVQTGRAARQDLAAVVTASGEIKPRNYVNIGANAMGRITEIYVKEGDRVRKGQVLAKLESIQPEADVNAQKAALSTAQAESAASEAAVKSADENQVTLQASLDRAKAELERTKLDFNRAKELHDAKLIARQEYDQKKAIYDAQAAGVREAEARIVGARSAREETAARLTAMQRRIVQSQSMLARLADVLQKHYSVAPLDGMVTNLPVRVGETMVMGFQNNPGSLIMTIADMSLITAEVKVDETDIVNVKLDQVTDVTIDAVSNRTFKGRVIEIGNTAILRSTGLAASQSAISSQEAKDFKVVVALDNPPIEIRPGLSCTAKVTTATRQNALTAPIQALTIRQRGDLEPQPASGGTAQAAAARVDPAAEKAKKEEIQGVFVIAGEKAQFRKVETGITGATDIEILSGLKDGDEIITGSYRVIRTLRNEAKIKVNNKAPEKKDS